MTTATFDLMDGIAATLAADSLATYRSDGSAYLPNETGVYFNDMPPDPDRVVVLTSYSASNDQPLITLGERRVQVKTRGIAGDVFDTETIADSIFNALHGLTNLMFGTVHVIQILRISSLALGQDEPQRRWMRSDNYAVDVDYAATALRP